MLEDICSREEAEAISVDIVKLSNDRVMIKHCLINSSLKK